MYLPEGGGLAAPTFPSSEPCAGPEPSALGLLPRMPWAPRPLLHTPASIKEGLGTGSRAWLPLRLQGRAGPFHLGPLELGQAKPAMWKLHSILLRLFSTALSLGICPATAPHRTFPKNSVVLWPVATTGLFIFASDSKSLSSSYISLEGLFGYLYKHSPSALIAVLWEPFYLSVISCFRAMKKL